MNRWQQLRRDESGMSYVFVGMGFMAMLAASMLAIDVGMLMTARSQAQNSADAGALAGATALAFDSWDDRSASGPAVTNAIMGAQVNQVAGGTVSVTPTDVEFLPNPDTGEMSRVRVTVYRSSTRGNPFDTLIAKYFGVRTAGVNAIATAEAAPANGMTCVKPFTVPDRWREVQDPAWDPSDTFERYDQHGRVIANPDVYVPAFDGSGRPDPGYTGYNNEGNRGMRLVLHASQGNQIGPSMYFALAMGSDTGGSDYDWNIANCNRTIYHWGDPLVQEPGNMVGPTIDGINLLIARDPGAYWDDATNTVMGSTFGSGACGCGNDRQSPRVFPIPLFDPDYWQAGHQTGRVASLRTANWIGFFVEYTTNTEIHGRVIPIAGIRDRTWNMNGSPAFPRTIVLVQ